MDTNFKNCKLKCFANSFFQLLKNIPELTNRLYRIHADPSSNPPLSFVEKFIMILPFLTPAQVQKYYCNIIDNGVINAIFPHDVALHKDTAEIFTKLFVSDLNDAHYKYVQQINALKNQIFTSYSTNIDGPIRDIYEIVYLITGNVVNYSIIFNSIQDHHFLGITNRKYIFITLRRINNSVIDIDKLKEDYNDYTPISFTLWSGEIDENGYAYGGHYINLRKNIDGTYILFDDTGFANYPNGKQPVVQADVQGFKIVSILLKNTTIPDEPLSGEVITNLREDNGQIESLLQEMTVAAVQVPPPKKISPDTPAKAAPAALPSLPSSVVPVPSSFVPVPSSVVPVPSSFVPPSPSSFVPPAPSSVVPPSPSSVVPAVYPSVVSIEWRPDIFLNYIGIIINSQQFNMMFQKSFDSNYATTYEYYFTDTDMLNETAIQSFKIYDCFLKDQSVFRTIHSNLHLRLRNGNGPDFPSLDHNFFPDDISKISPDLVWYIDTKTPEIHIEILVNMGFVFRDAYDATHTRIKLIYEDTSAKDLKTEKQKIIGALSDVKCKIKINSEFVKLGENLSTESREFGFYFYPVFKREGDENIIELELVNSTNIHKLMLKKNITAFIQDLKYPKSSTSFLDFYSFPSPSGDSVNFPPYSSDDNSIFTWHTHPKHFGYGLGGFFSRNDLGFYLNFAPLNILFSSEGIYVALRNNHIYSLKNLIPNNVFMAMIKDYLFAYQSYQYTLMSFFISFNIQDSKDMLSPTPLNLLNIDDHDNFLKNIYKKTGRDETNVSIKYSSSDEKYEVNIQDAELISLFSKGDDIMDIEFEPIFKNVMNKIFARGGIYKDRIVLENKTIYIKENSIQTLVGRDAVIQILPIGNHTYQDLPEINTQAPYQLNKIKFASEKYIMFENNITYPSRSKTDNTQLVKCTVYENSVPVYSGTFIHYLGYKTTNILYVEPYDPQLTKNIVVNGRNYTQYRKSYFDYFISILLQYFCGIYTGGKKDLSLLTSYYEFFISDFINKLTFGKALSYDQILYTKTELKKIDSKGEYTHIIDNLENYTLFDIMYYRRLSTTGDFISINYDLKKIIDGISRLDQIGDDIVLKENIPGIVQSPNAFAETLDLSVSPTVLNELTDAGYFMIPQTGYSIDLTDMAKLLNSCFKTTTKTEASLSSPYYVNVGLMKHGIAGVLNYASIKLSHPMNEDSTGKRIFGKDGKSHSRLVNSIWNVCSTGRERDACSKMMFMIAEHIKTQNTNPTILYVLKNNKPAIKCYFKAGFRIMKNYNVKRYKKDDDYYAMVYARK